MKSTLNGVTTCFIGGHYEVTGSTVTKYYGVYPEPSRRAGAQRVATPALAPGASVRTGSTLSYFLSDHLGSTSITTNSTGGLVSELRYKPWGETRYSSGTTPAKYQYTGQYSNMSDFGLMFYNARWYDPALGRFNQPDTIIPEQSQGTQAWDRFAYANNNPVKFNDPTGHCAAPGLSIICGVAIGYVAGGLVSYTRQVAANVKANGWSANSFTQVDANDIAASAIVGGIAGGLIGSGVGASAGVAMIASSAGTGMAVSAIGYTLAAGDDYETSEMVGSAIIGGVAGALSGGVSNILKTPLPLTSRLPVNDSGAWFVEATLKGAVNGAASGIQTALYGDPEMIPGASVAGGFLGYGLEVIPGPSWVPVAINSFVRSVAAETYVNEITDCDGTYDSSACAK